MKKNEKEKFYIREIQEEEYMKMLDENKNGNKNDKKNGNEKFYIREMNEEGYMENEKLYIKEIPKEEYRKMKNEKINIREMNEEGYMKMLDENKNDKEKFYIREIQEEEYMKMLDEKNNLEKKIMIYMENDILKIDKFLFLNDKVELKQTAFDGLFSNYEISGNGMDIPNYLSYVKNMVFDLIENYLIESNIKIQLILNVLTSVGDYGFENYREDNTYLHSITKLITKSNFLNEIYEEITDEILETFSSYESKGSGWKFMGVQYLEILITKVKHFGGSSYMDLPLEIKNKKAFVNVQNKNDNECFKYSILAALHYDEIKDNLKRPSNYIKWQNELNFEGIDFPVK